MNYVYFQSNPNLTGTIPNFGASMPAQFSQLFLNNTELSGPLPIGLSTLTNMQYFAVNNNNHPRDAAHNAIIPA